MTTQSTPQLSDILRLPGNEAAYHLLQERLRSGGAVAFVGAGASVPLYPLWGGLIREMAAEALYLGRATQADHDYWLSIAGTRPQQAVSGIKKKLGKRQYGALLGRIFGPRREADGHSYTPAHSVLMRMPFAGYITTNYDPGLLEARSQLRSGVSPFSYATWKDNDLVVAWYTGDVFDTDACPVLYAHGIYQRSDTIALTMEEYRNTYAPGPYRRLFESLWGQGHLVFVGFGFSDPWFDFIADQVITQSAAEAAGEPRHIAILGLFEEENYTPEMRVLFVNTYNAEPLLYPVRMLEDNGQDHGGLMTILESLAVQPSLVPPLPDSVAEGVEDEGALLPHWSQKGIGDVTTKSSVRPSEKGASAHVPPCDLEIEAAKEYPESGQLGQGRNRQSPRLKYLRQCLIESFAGTGEVRDFCEDHLGEEVIYQLPENAAITELVRAIIRYCKSREQLDILYDFLAKERPGKYASYYQDYGERFDYKNRLPQNRYA